eukprot:UN26008
MQKYVSPSSVDYMALKSTGPLPMDVYQNNEGIRKSTYDDANVLSVDTHRKSLGETTRPRSTHLQLSDLDLVSSDGLTPDTQRNPCWFRWCLGGYVE